MQISLTVKLKVNNLEHRRMTCKSHMQKHDLCMKSPFPIWSPYTTWSLELEYSGTLQRMCVIKREHKRPINITERSKITGSKENICYPLRIIIHLFDNEAT